MKAILVKYFGPTTNSGSRIKAQAEGVNSLTVPYPYELSGEAVYRSAAEQLCIRYGWPTDLVGGQLPNGDWAFCFASAKKKRFDLDLTSRESAMSYLRSLPQHLIVDLPGYLENPTLIGDAVAKICGESANAFGCHHNRWKWPLPDLIAELEKCMALETF